MLFGCDGETIFYQELMHHFNMLKIFSEDSFGYLVIYELRVLLSFTSVRKRPIKYQLVKG